MGLEQLTQPGQLAQLGSTVFHGLNNVLSGAGQFAGNVHNVSRLVGNIGQQQSAAQPQLMPRVPNVGTPPPMQVPQPNPPVQLQQGPQPQQLNALARMLLGG